MTKKMHPYRTSPSDLFDVISAARALREEYRKVSAQAVQMLESDPETRAILRDGRAWIRHENRKTRTNQEMAEDAGF
jgi:hypothetical protein